MEMIEGILWIMTGFIPTLVFLELASRLAKKRLREPSLNRPITVKQEIISQ
jgi:hypothetical protein